MTIWVVLLRGVNVGGHGKLPMADLRSELGQAGFEQVKTYIQSGNIVLSSSLEAEQVGGEVAALIDARFGFRPQVMVRSAERFAATVEGVPFDTTLVEAKFVHLYFHDGGEDAADLDKIRELAVDEVYASGRGAFYLLTPNGFSRSKLAEKIPTCISAPVTARNLNSCRRISDLAMSLR